MRQRHVVVLYEHRLFGEAIARALTESGRLRADILPADSLSRDTLDAMQPDALVLEQAPAAGDIMARLLDASPVLTFIIGPESNIAEVYEKHEVIPATAADIIARIMHRRR